MMSPAAVADLVIEDEALEAAEDADLGEEGVK